jgi:acyl-coenzyme A thioesterase PaaI-like protein
MGFADTAMYACMHAVLGADVVAVMSNLMITFIRPARASDLIADARLIRRGRSLAYLEVYLYSDGSADPVAHATSTFAYRFPPLVKAAQ